MSTWYAPCLTTPPLPPALPQAPPLLTCPPSLHAQAVPALEGLGLDGGGESPFLALCDNSFLA